MNRALAFSSWIISTYRRTTHGITFTCIFCTVVKYKASFNRDSASSPAQMLMCLRGSRGGGGEGRGPDPPPPLRNHKAIGILSDTGPASLENHKVTKPAFNFGSSSARQRNAI